MNIDKIRGGLGFVRAHETGDFSFTEWEQARIKNIVVFDLDAELNKKKRFWTYRKRVYALTESVAHLIPGICKRAFKGHHIDHIFPIWYGFRLGITAEQIADLSNLRMLYFKENMKKGTRIV